MPTQKNLVKYLQKRVKGDMRFWFNQVDGVNQFTESVWPKSKDILLKLLRNEITNGFHSIAIPYLSVKLFNGFSRIDDMKNNPPQEVLNVMHAIGNGIADLLASQTVPTQKNLVKYLQKRVKGDMRFWFNQVDGVNQFTESVWPKSKDILLKLLRNEITNGFHSIAIPYLSVKLFNGFSRIDDMKNATWFKQINSNYGSVLTPHRGRTNDTPTNANQLQLLRRNWANV